MDRRSALKFLGLAPFAPALLKVAGDGVAIRTIEHPINPYVVVHSDGYFNVLNASMIETKEIFAANILKKEWEYDRS